MFRCAPPNGFHRHFSTQMRHSSVLVYGGAGGGGRRRGRVKVCGNPSSLCPEEGAIEAFVADKWNRSVDRPLVADSASPREPRPPCRPKSGCLLWALASIGRPLGRAEVRSEGRPEDTGARASDLDDHCRFQLGILRSRRLEPSRAVANTRGRSTTDRQAPSASAPCRPSFRTTPADFWPPPL